MKKTLYIISLCMLLTACRDVMPTDSPEVGNLDDVIRVGSATIDDMDVNVSYATRAENNSSPAAEQQPWLITPLKQGLDITYGNISQGNRQNENVAILKLKGADSLGDDEKAMGPVGNQYAVDNETDLAIYSFKYRDPSVGDDAKWYSNGTHFFEGVYVPKKIRYGAGTDITDDNDVTYVDNIGAPGIVTNQSDDNAVETEGNQLGNYTLLSHYLGMPANTRISATVGRIQLPFRHRLARVLAFVLIDPSMTGVTLEGYKKNANGNSTETDNPNTTAIRFCNVDVLAGVKDEKLGDAENAHHTLTPQWKTPRKVIPHFIGESGSVGTDGTELDSDFLVFYNLDTKVFVFMTDSNWKTVKNIYENAPGTSEKEKEENCRYRKINYGKVPVYDLIVRPTYTSLDNVMYDEDIYNADGTINETKRKELYAKKNKIDFEIKLSNGLEYTKEFNFDLNANYQTIVYMRISRESVDYNSSGSEKWKETEKRDEYYGVDNALGHSLSMAGSSWQRAFTRRDDKYINDGKDQVTDGGFYDEGTTGDDNATGQYLSEQTWVKYLTEAHEGGMHHGDYFYMDKDVTIDAKDLPENFVFTGHLDGNGKTITVKDAGKWVENTERALSQLSYKTGSGETDADYSKIPQLYFVRQIAQAKPAKASEIPSGKYEMLDMETVTPADILADMVLYTKVTAVDGKDTYLLFPYRTFYRKNATALFYGLNGIYTTNQEKPASEQQKDSNGKVIYEANVHKANNSDLWIPYKTETNGWRAEILNLTVSGQLFYDNAIITGNVQNCKDVNGEVNDHIPDNPRY